MGTLMSHSPQHPLEPSMPHIHQSTIIVPLRLYNSPTHQALELIQQDLEAPFSTDRESYGRALGPWLWARSSSEGKVPTEG